MGQWGWNEMIFKIHPKPFCASPEAVTHPLHLPWLLWRLWGHSRSVPRGSEPCPRAVSSSELAGEEAEQDGQHWGSCPACTAGSRGQQGQLSLPAQSRAALPQTLPDERGGILQSIHNNPFTALHPFPGSFAIFLCAVKPRQA